jgi:hypothetical protein
MTACDDDEQTIDTNVDIDERATSTMTAPEWRFGSRD